MNRATAVSIPLLLTACAPLRPQPPTGAMWGFFWEPEGGASPRLVVYAPERRTCETVRAGIAKGPSEWLPWLRVKTPSECLHTVVGAGGDYWVFAGRGAAGFAALGWSGDRAHCVDLRAKAQRSTGRWDIGDCQPVAIEFGGPVPGPVGSRARCAGINTLPMYGYDPGHPENSCDIAFIESMTRNGKSRSQASLEVANIGWHALRAKDLDRAIKRFNQAWLLDRQSALALWGFGVWEALNGNYVRAEEFLRQAVAIRQGDPGLYVDLGRTVMINATQANDAAKLAEARVLFVSAKGIDPNFVPAYIQEAALDLHEERYADAWEQVMRAEKLDPKGVDAELIAELEKKMPRPVR